MQVSKLMLSRGRETILLVKYENIIHLPVVGGVTTGAVVAHCLVVQIRMGGNTIAGSLLKYHGGVTGTTVSLFVAACERESRLTIVRKPG